MPHLYTDEEKRRLDLEDKWGERRIRAKLRNCLPCWAKYELRYVIIAACVPLTPWVIVWFR